MAEVALQSYWEIYDAWFWKGGSDSLYTRKEKQERFLKANPMCTDSMLRNWRFFSAVVCYFIEIYYWYKAEVWWKSPLVYLTGWGWYSWLSYNAIVCYAHIKFDINQIPMP